MLHWRVSGLYRRRVCALMWSFLSVLVTLNSSKFELLSRILWWFEMPSYSTQTFELFRRSGRRRTCAFQFPIRKSKSCEPSRCGRLAGFVVFWANDGAAGVAAIMSSKMRLNLVFIVFYLECTLSNNGIRRAMRGCVSYRNRVPEAQKRGPTETRRFAFFRMRKNRPLPA